MSIQNLICKVIHKSVRTLTYVDECDDVKLMIKKLQSQELFEESWVENIVELNELHDEEMGVKMDKEMENHVQVCATLKYLK